MRRASESYRGNFRENESERKEKRERVAARLLCLVVVRHRDTLPARLEGYRLLDPELLRLRGEVELEAERLHRVLKHLTQPVV